MKKMLLCLCACALSGCIPLQDIKSVPIGAHLDVASTAFALNNPSVREINPLVHNDPLMGAITVYGLKVGAVHLAKKLPNSQCEQAIHGLNAISMGAAVNNIGVILGAANALSVGAGTIAGIVTYRSKHAPYCR